LTLSHENMSLKENLDKVRKNENKLTYESIDEKIILPIHKNYYLQGLIYQTFSLDLTNKLHKNGFL